MIGYYTPVLLVQAICIYHAYRNNAEQRWYWLILFFPVVGCVIYVFHHFSGRSGINTINTISEGVKGAVYSNYRIEQLEKAYRFSDNVKNRVNLADAYFDHGRLNDAIKLYSESLKGIMADDTSIRMKLLNAYYCNKNFEEAISLGSQLESEKIFRNAEQRLAYAWSLHHQGQTEAAENIFSEMDKPLTNFRHRIEYSRFLIEISKPEEAKRVLDELMSEFEHMRGLERRTHRDTMREAERLLSKLSTTK